MFRDFLAANLLFKRIVGVIYDCIWMQYTHPFQVVKQGFVDQNILRFSFIFFRLQKTPTS